MNALETFAKGELAMYGRWNEEKTNQIKARLEFCRRSLDELLHTPERREQLEMECETLEARIRFCGFDAK